MTDKIRTVGVNHISLTVSDVARSKAFYLALFDAQHIRDLDLPSGPLCVMVIGQTALTLSNPPHKDKAIPGDRFDMNRIGLDHLSFNVPTFADMKHAMEICDAQGVQRGEPDDQRPGLPLFVMTIWDPDGIQLEITAPVDPD